VTVKRERWVVDFYRIHKSPDVTSKVRARKETKMLNITGHVSLRNLRMVMSEGGEEDGVYRGTLL